MRSKEEFKSLVYCKRDKLIAEENINKSQGLNNRSKIWWGLSSVVAACIIAAVVLPNVNPPSSSPAFDKEAGSPADLENDGASGGNSFVAPAPDENAEGVLPPFQSDAYPEDESPSVEVKLTVSLSSRPDDSVEDESVEAAGGIIGKLTGELGDEYVIISSYEQLDGLFSELCEDVNTEDVFPRDLFSSGHFVVAVARPESHSGADGAVYLNASLDSGALRLEVSCVGGSSASGERCVDFAIIHAPNTDPDSILSVNVVKSN